MKVESEFACEFAAALIRFIGNGGGGFASAVQRAGRRVGFFFSFSVLPHLPLGPAPIDETLTGNSIK